MLKSYFRSAFRNLWKSRAFSVLNILGLSIGIACAALILLWVEDETTFNHNFTSRDRIYRVMQNEKSDAGIFTNGDTPGPLAEALMTDIPGIINSGRLSWPMDQLAITGDKLIKENGIYADPSILLMYPIPLIQGVTRLALQDPQSVVISETFARKLFGEENPMGKTVRMNAGGAYSVDGLYRVTGVFADLPANCSFHFQWISPYKTWENANPWLKPWNNNLSETYVELSPSADLASINKKLSGYLATRADGSKNKCFLFSMNDWNLRAHFENGLQTGGNIRYVRLFSLIALATLMIACINFMNLATARSELRAKEVGVLKVMGARRAGLIGKFIGESMLVSALAVLLALCLLYAAMPAYNLLVGKQLSMHLSEPLHLVSLAAVTIFCGVLAGSYPAFYLSSFNPVDVLKSKWVKGSLRTVFVRKGLVITQFAVSVTLIICTAIIYQQVRHIRNRDLGYNKDKLVYLNLEGSMLSHFGELKNKLISTGYVENAAISLHDALHVYSYGDGFSWTGKDPNQKIPVHSNVVSPEYISTMHMRMISGRDFYQSAPDTGTCVINESMARLMGREGRVGSIISSGPYQVHVVGIMHDFIYNDVYGDGAPLILICGTYSATVMALRFKQNADLRQALAQTEAVIRGVNPGHPFEYHFADTEFYKLFAAETLIGKLAGVFAALAVLISSLGLFGLAAYTAERRTREIGIRKVLGASVQGIAVLISREFVLLVILSCLVAFPLAWWMMHGWLENYEYRTVIRWWVFGAAGLLALVVALLTVSFQAIRAALLNPVKSLRTE
jgi:ABC-type lipoprotein release transport system permease subunit